MPKLEMNDAEKYFASLPEAQAKILTDLRKRITKIAKAESDLVISYQLPTFVVEGKKFLSLGAWRAHYAIYPLSGSLGARIEPLVSQGEFDKGTIRFAWHELVTDETIRVIVAAKRAEIIERGR
jgi:uncharacterized protein YdhG (YjbR/CyaY superfamily)